MSPGRGATDGGILLLVESTEDGKLLSFADVFSPTLDRVGGNKKTWNHYDDIGSNIETNLSPDPGNMWGLRYEVKPQRSFNPPFTLDPSISTFEDICNHALTRQNMATSTVNQYLKLARLMKIDPCVPVDFKHPTWERFFTYMDYIKTHDASPHALKNRRKAWHMFCRAWGIKDWPTYALPTIPDHSFDILIPTPETVYDLLHHHYVGDKYLDRLIQYTFFTGFMVGMRPEKEMLILDVDDVVLDDYDNYTITIHEPKKHDNARTLRIEENIAVSSTRKSFKNYVDTIRPRFAARGEDALLINPETGGRWNEDNLRHRLLNEYGKRVWGRFYPYIMRHWALTARCIEWQADNTVLARVQHWAGHKKLEQTLRYLSLASLYNSGKGSWLSRALKRSDRIGGSHDAPDKERISKNKPLFVPSTSGNKSESRQVRYFSSITWSSLYRCTFHRNN